MSSKGNVGDTGPLFVLATRMYVHYKFKTRSSFSPEAALIDDDYAREVLALVRATGDKALLEMADRFEAGRFPGRETPSLDLALENG